MCSLIISIHILLPTFPANPIIEPQFKVVFCFATRHLVIIDVEVQTKTNNNLKEVYSFPIIKYELAEMPSSEQHDLKIMPKSIVCEDSTLIGDITISPGCVIHPSATIIAEFGPIILGENCIVEEYATIAYRRPAGSDSSAIGKALSIGANNVFEVFSTVEAKAIGEKNVFECKSYVGPQVTVSNGCVIGAGVQLKCAQDLTENSVIFGKDRTQREAIEKLGVGSQTLQIDFLRKVLPNYHHLRKANYDPKKARAAV